MLSEILPIAVELVPDNSQKLLAFGVFPGGGGRLSRLKHARLSPFDKVRERKARNVHPSEIFMRGTHSYTVIFETYFRRSLIRHLGTHLTSRIYQTVPPAQWGANRELSVKRLGLGGVHFGDTEPSNVWHHLANRSYILLQVVTLKDFSPGWFFFCGGGQHTSMVTMVTAGVVFNISANSLWAAALSEMQQKKKLFFGGFFCSATKQCFNRLVRNNCYTAVEGFFRWEWSRVASLIIWRSSAALSLSLSRSLVVHRSCFQSSVSYGCSALKDTACLGSQREAAGNNIRKICESYLVVESFVSLCLQTRVSIR